MILFITGWIIFFSYVSPDTVVKKIGIQNTYGIAFILGLLCGFSSVTGTAFYIAVATMARGGANPLLLGLIGGLGLCISDFGFYFIVSKGTHVIDRHWLGFSEFIRRWIKVIPDWAIYLCVFCYSAFVPIPNDILLVALAVGGTRFKKIAVFLFAGDIISTTLLAYISR